MVDDSAEAFRLHMVFFIFNRHREFILEMEARFEKAWRNELEHRPQFRKIVLQRRARGDDFELRVQLESGLRAFRLAVLDGLRFIEHDDTPADFAEGFDFTLEQSIRNDHQR